MDTSNGNGFRELTGRHILVVEDCSSTRGIMARLLSREGARVSVCENGRLAVAQIEELQGDEQPVDLVLMDMDMPILDGYAATQMLRARGHTLPIIAVTAGSSGPDRATCLSIGCDDYASKPIDHTELVQLIQLCLCRTAANK